MEEDEEVVVKVEEEEEEEEKAEVQHERHEPRSLFFGQCKKFPADLKNLLLHANILSCS